MSTTKQRKTLRDAIEGATDGLIHPRAELVDAIFALYGTEGAHRVARLIDDEIERLADLDRRQRELLGGAKRTCRRCGNTYRARRSDSRYCSVRCRVAAHRAAVAAR